MSRDFISQKLLLSRNNFCERKKIALAKPGIEAIISKMSAIEKKFDNGKKLIFSENFSFEKMLFVTEYHVIILTSLNDIIKHKRF